MGDFYSQNLATVGLSQPTSTGRRQYPEVWDMSDHCTVNNLCLFELIVGGVLHMRVSVHPSRVLSLSQVNLTLLLAEGQPMGPQQ